MVRDRLRRIQRVPFLLTFYLYLSDALYTLYYASKQLKKSYHQEEERKKEKHFHMIPLFDGYELG